MARDRNEHNLGPSDTIDLTQLVTIVSRKKNVVIRTGVIVFVAVMAITMLSPVTFSSTSRMYLGELGNKSPSAAEEVELNPSVNSDIDSEVEILRSRSLVAKAVLASGLNARLSYLGQDIPRYWKWRISRRNPELFDAAAKRLRVTETDFIDRAREPVTFVIRFVSNDTYEVLTETFEPLGKGKLDAKATVTGLSLHLAKGVESPVPGDEFELVVNPLNLEVDEALKLLSVTTPKTTGVTKPNVVTLSYSDKSPLLSAEFLKALMKVYLAERQEWKTQDATAAEDFVSSQLVTLGASLEKARKDLADFRANNRVVVLDSEAESMIAQISKYEEQRVAARLEAAALADVEKALKGSNPAPEAFMLGEAQDSVLGNLASSLSSSRQTLTELETRFSAEAPDVVRQREQVKAQLGTIRSYVSNRLSRARENLSTLGGVIGRYEERLKTVPGAELQLAQLTREAEVYDSMYSFLLKRQQQAAITKASTVSKNRILDEPEIPFLESSPELKLRLASAPVGLLLGVVIVLVGSFLSRTYQSGNDVYGSLGGTPVFATLPQGLPNAKRLRDHNDASVDLLQHQVSFGFLEAFRTLRTNLYLAAPVSPREGRVILITSASPGDGKTTCALSLAWILAADGKRVLVIDADLRKPSHFLMAGGHLDHNRKDLVSVLTGECSWQEAALPIAGTQRAIFSLGVSRPAPAELLSAHNLRMFLSQAKCDCDYIIVDSPSFPLVSDALVMAPATDVVLSVIRPEHTPRRLATEHIARLKEASNVFAVVINDSNSHNIYGGAYPSRNQLAAHSEV